MKNKNRIAAENKSARNSTNKCAASACPAQGKARVTAARRRPVLPEDGAQTAVSSVLPAETAKTAFLRVLPRCGGVAHAIKESGIEPCLLYYCLQNDESFRREFDRAINTKLELELIDRTLEGKPAGLFGFTLPALMPEKYDAKYDAPRDATPPVVIFEPARKADK